MAEPTSETDKPNTPSRSRRLLWATAALAGVVMVVAAWQLRQTPVEAPTATEAFNEAAGEPELEQAPDFSVPLLDGSTFELSEHLTESGGPVLLNLWASWCIPCRNEMPLLDDVAPLFPGVVFLGVAVNDNRDAAASFANEVGVTYPIGFDIDGGVVEGYPAPAMPVTYIIDGEGRMAGRFFGELDIDRIEALLDGVT